MPTGIETITVHLTPDGLTEVAQALATYHKRLRDEDTRLIIRHKLSDRKNIHLLEVMGKFPAAPGEKLSRYEFPPSKDLMIPGKYYFTLVSPTQIDHAITHRHPLLLAIAREASELTEQADERMLLYSASKTDQRFWTKIKALS